MPTGSRSWKKDKILFECSATPLGAETFCALASDGSPAAMFFEAKGKGKKRVQDFTLKENRSMLKARAKATA